MTKKCIYCKQEIDQDSVVDFCKKCGVGVWGEKMFNAIVKSMEDARSTGDLFQGGTPEEFGIGKKEPRTQNQDNLLFID
jgi:hypothetical protein